MELTFGMQRRAVSYAVSYLRKEIESLEKLSSEGRLPDILKPRLDEMKRDLTELEVVNDAWS